MVISLFLADPSAILNRICMLQCVDLLCNSLISSIFSDGVLVLCKIIHYMDKGLVMIFRYIFWIKLSRRG